MSESPAARFVVGTGRCGSTLLSRMLTMNSRILNLFELFSGIEEDFRFGAGPVSGPALADQLRLDHPMLTMTLKRGGAVPEVVYPFDDPGSRYSLGDPVPWALSIAIPRISDDPDRLFDELLAWVAERPTVTLPEHYRAIFDWLTERSGKDCWLERSGSSIETLGELKAFFPEARFVHIHRDGRETALSMREYATLRLAVAVMNGMAGEVDYTHAGLSALDREQPERVDELLAARPPIELYARYWTDQLRAGYAARAKLDPDVVMDVRFEELVTRPKEVLSAIADFLELPDDGDWIDRAAALSHGLPKLRYPDLPAEEQARLEEACREGMALVGREIDQSPR